MEQAIEEGGEDDGIIVVCRSLLKSNNSPRPFNLRHSRGNPEYKLCWIPAYARMTRVRQATAGGLLALIVGNQLRVLCFRQTATTNPSIGFQYVFEFRPISSPYYELDSMHIFLLCQEICSHLLGENCLPQKATISSFSWGGVKGKRGNYGKCRMLSYYVTIFSKK